MIKGKHEKIQKNPEKSRKIPHQKELKPEICFNSIFQAILLGG
ncbi:MAG: hypothetical protein ACI93R_004170 [Flavobacteriales bacterium]